MKDTVQQIKKKELAKLDAASTFAKAFDQTMRNYLYVAALVQWHSHNQSRAGRLLNPRDFEDLKAIIKTASKFESFVADFCSRVERTKQEIASIHDDIDPSVIAFRMQRGPSTADFQVFGRINVIAKRIADNLGLTIKAGKK